MKVLLYLVLTTTLIQLEVYVVALLTLRKFTPYNNIISSLVSDPQLAEKHSVTVLFSNRKTDRIDACLKSVYERTAFGVRLIGRLEHHAEILRTGSEWFLIVGGDDAEDDDWWRRAVAEVYRYGPYRPTVVLWFNEPLTMATRHRILLVTWRDYWLHKTIIAYPSQCDKAGNGSCIVLTATKDSTTQIDSQISMVSLLADENNLTAAVDSMKSAQREFETDFNGRTLKTTVSLKTSYIESVQFPGDQTELVGIDIEALNAICAQLNLTPVIEVVDRGSVYTDNLNATLLSLDNRKKSFFLNRYFNSPSVKEYMLPVSIDTFHFTMRNRQKECQVWKIFSGFQPTVWMMVGVTFVVVALIWRCILAGSTLSLVQAALSTSHVELRLSRHRLVWISWLLFVLLIVNSLNGTIVTQLTKPLYNHEITTLKELLASGLRLYTEVRGFTNERQDPVVAALAPKLVDINAQRPSVDDVSRAAFLTSSNTRSILRRLNHDFYVIPEVVDQLCTGYLMSPRNPAFDTFKETVATLLETGYYEKWTRDYVNNVTQNTYKYYFYHLYNTTSGVGGGRGRTSAMSLEDLVLAFRMYLIGALLAFIAFLGEIFIYEFRKPSRQREEHNEPKRKKHVLIS